MDRRGTFRRTMRQSLAIRLVAVLAAVLLGIALLAPLAFPGRTGAPSESVSPSASARATLSASPSIPAFPDVPLDTPETAGTIHPGDVAVVGDASGGKLLIRFRDVTQVVDPPGIQPSAPGDVFLEASVDVKALSVSTFINAWKTFGGQELGAGSAWPTPYLVVPESLEPGQIVTGKLGFEVPPTGEVTVLFPGRPGAAARLELRPASVGPTPSPIAPDGWPVTLDGSVEPIVGPDGTVYESLTALDSSGHLISDRSLAPTSRRP